MRSRFSYRPTGHPAVDFITPRMLGLVDLTNFEYRDGTVSPNTRHPALLRKGAKPSDPIRCATELWASGRYPMVDPEKQPTRLTGSAIWLTDKRTVIAGPMKIRPQEGATPIQPGHKIVFRREISANALILEAMRDADRGPAALLLFTQRTDIFGSLRASPGGPRLCLATTNTADVLSVDRDAVARVLAHRAFRGVEPNQMLELASYARLIGHPREIGIEALGAQRARAIERAATRLGGPLVDAVRHLPRCDSDEFAILKRIWRLDVFLRKQREKT